MQFNYHPPMHQAPPSHIKALSPDFETPHFKQALSRFATGVTVITTFAPGAHKGDSASHSFVGITASSFNSVSLTPPLVLWSLGQGASSAPLFHAGTHYVVNVLAADQKDLAATFFKPQKAVGGRFETVPFSLGELGLPLLDDALGALECELVGEVAHGDHTVFVAAVRQAVLLRDGAALELSSTGWQYGG